ncbi:hypothetical protein CAPTEDRAFT_223305 [Capitella teleta]|uniref:Uncharacterized protein n=1 Tax=Capitella teleta TaxID=283909 RepID=R7VDT9_CAPTE|nr:hypothetical protein CAPTEDRAFT_223305 [Capitella teleta]|eukprot:ELU16707.1 hypothetical protein CAPTEDRAFT_223305 [Capitella teleta]
MTIGWRTLDVGEKALIYTAQGHARVEAGPKRLFLFLEKFIPLDCFTADQTEYLRITYKNGTIAHRSGPCAMFRNPVEVASVEVMNGVSLDANEVLVVYRLDPKTQSVSKYIRPGPTIFIPTANECDSIRFHEFEWHGTDPNNKTKKIPRGLHFTKLQVIPDQFYYNVDEVRTADDALIRVKLMIFYELRDIEKMLSATSDPIADFINYMEFIERSSQLNDLNNYPQLQERCRVIGYVVSKVGFRGYHASPTLQSMHDVAIMKRTELKAEFETEEQNQGMTDLLLQNDCRGWLLNKEWKSQI